MRQLANKQVRTRVAIVSLAIGALWPVVVLLATGSVATLTAIYGAEALVVLAARLVARRLGLPAWAPDESYVSRLRRWRRARRA